MEFPESLQTIAEIGIGLAGFSGLIVALRKRAGPLPEVQKYRLQILLYLAFGGMFLSLLPELLFEFGVEPFSVWRFSAAAMFVYSTFFLVWWVVASIWIKRKNPEIFDWFAFSRMMTGHTAVMIVLLLIIFSLADIAADAVYVAALIWYLVHSAQQFTRMLFVRPKGDEAR